MISICMAYINRKQQLLKTLDSINESSIKDYEIIIVDDGSNEEHVLNINELKEHSNGNIKLFTVDKNKKTWHNSCIAFNIAFSAAAGDKIIIQNPETFHLGDLLLVINQRLSNSVYLTVHTLAINSQISEELYKRNTIADVSTLIHPIMQQTRYLGFNHNGILWYNHKIYRPNHYHFLSAITRENLYNLGGFDERFKDDHSYDDDEFILRIHRLHLSTQFIENPQAVHIYHPMAFSAAPHNGSKNEVLFNNVCRREQHIKVQDLNLDKYMEYLI